MQRGVASKICFGPVVQMAIPTLGLLCVGSDACAVDQPSIRSPTISRKMWFINVLLNLLLNVGSMKVIQYPTKQRLQIKCDNFDCIFEEVKGWKMLWEQLVDLQSHSAKYCIVSHLSVLIQPFCWNEIFHINQAVVETHSKSCRSSCLESQIINIKLKKNQQKVPGPPPKLSASDRRTCGNFQHCNQVITMAVDALVPRIPRPSAAMILNTGLTGPCLPGGIISPACVKSVLKKDGKCKYLCFLN